ncbi:hypothetical protein PY310_21300, partial [Pseudarthrobacter sp. H3Y2-7]|uniref:hypothetical protein n=1 Tax=Pseudarthrobacter naphthalenicus TaxID=3031328 RepID=UPI0023AF00D9
GTVRYFLPGAVYFTKCRRLQPLGGRKLRKEGKSGPSIMSFQPVRFGIAGFAMQVECHPRFPGTIEDNMEVTS